MSVCSNVCVVKCVYVSYQNCMYEFKALHTELFGLLRKQIFTHVLFECRSELFKCCSDVFKCCSDLFTSCSDLFRFVSCCCSIIQICFISIFVVRVMFGAFTALS